MRAIRIKAEDWLDKNRHVLFNHALNLKSEEELLEAILNSPKLHGGTMVVNPLQHADLSPPEWRKRLEPDCSTMRSMMQSLSRQLRPASKKPPTIWTTTPMSKIRLLQRKIWVRLHSMSDTSMSLDKP